MLEVLHPRMEYFLACAAEKSFVAASLRLGVTQPTLSTSIGKLEEELGFQLFDRGAEGISLTKQGLSLYEELLTHRRQIREKIASTLHRREQPVIRMGCVGHIATFRLLDVLENLKDKLPMVHLFTSTSFECMEEVVKGNLDFAIVAWSSVPKRVKSIRVADEPVRFVGLRKKFAAIEKMKSIKELHTFPWVHMPKPQLDWRQFLELDKPTYLARDVRALRTFIFRGLAIGYLQLTMFSKEELKRLAISSVPGFYDDPAIYLVYPAKGETNKELAMYRDLVLQAYVGTRD